MPIKKEKEMERYIYQNMKGQGEKNKLSTHMLIKKEKEIERYVLFLFLFLDKMEQYGFWKGKINKLSAFRSPECPAYAI